MVGPLWIQVWHVTGAKARAVLWNHNAELGGVGVHGGVTREREAVPKSGVEQAGGEELAHQLHGVDGLLFALGRKAVHQVGVDQDTGHGEGVGAAGHLLHCDPLRHSLKQAVGGDLQAAGDGDHARGGEQTAQVGREGLLEADVAPEGDAESALQDAECQVA